MSITKEEGERVSREAHDTAEALVYTLDNPYLTDDFPNVALDVVGRIDQPIAQALVISLSMIVSEILSNSAVQ